MSVELSLGAHDRLGDPVVLADVAKQLAAEVCSRGEDAAVNEIALGLGEPALWVPSRDRPCGEALRVGLML